jgi:hypothetical protein
VKVVGIVSSAGVPAGIAGIEAGATAAIQPFNLTEEADYLGCARAIRRPGFASPVLLEQVVAA